MFVQRVCYPAWLKLSRGDPLLRPSEAAALSGGLGRSACWHRVPCTQHLPAASPGLPLAQPLPHPLLDSSSEGRWVGWLSSSFSPVVLLNIMDSSAGGGSWGHHNSVLLEGEPLARDHHLHHLALLSNRSGNLVYSQHSVVLPVLKKLVWRRQEQGQEQAGLPSACACVHTK